MLRASESVHKERAKVLRDRADSKLVDEEFGRRLIEADPDSSDGYMTVGLARLAAGDLEGAEGLLWKALERAPSSYLPYLALVSRYSQTDPDGVLPLALTALGAWKAYFSGEVPEELAEMLRGETPGTDEADDDPDAFEHIAEQMQAEVERRKWPDRLLP